MSERPQARKQNSRRRGGTLKDAERRRLAARFRERRGRSSGGAHVLRCDGGVRGRRAAFAYVLEETDGTVIEERAGRLDAVSATTAEYSALLEGLRAARRRGIPALDVLLDAQLVVAHLTGERKTKNASLRQLGDEAASLARAIGRVDYRWVPRDENGRANALVERELRSSDAHASPG